MRIPEIPRAQNIVRTIPNFTTPVQLRCDSCSKVIDTQMIQNVNTEIPFYPDPTYRPPPKPVKISVPKIPESMDTNPELNMNFEENSPFQKGVKLKTYQRPDKSFFHKP